MDVIAQLANLPELAAEHADGITTITLNRPEANNALNRALSESLVTAINTLAEHAATRVIILTGAGQAFCAGVDLKALTNDPSILTANGLGTSSPIVAAFSRCAKPIIGAINGAAVTGGFELALACDFLYAAESARFADTHARVGILPGWGLSQKLSRIIGINRAREMSLSGKFIDAQTALNWGLVNAVTPAESLLSTVALVAKEIANADAPTVQTLKQLINDGWATSLEDGLVLEEERSKAHLAKVDFKDMDSRLATLRERAKRQPG